MLLNRKLRVYSDGASRGNPGPSAVAFMILGEDGKVLARHSNYVGIRTNNQSEYEALISALEFASQLTTQELVCYMDSKLVVKHLNNEYQVRDSKLKILWLQVNELKQRFQKTSFRHVSRTDSHIQQVDWLANQTLNRLNNRK